MQSLHPSMDGNYNYRLKAQPKSTHRRSRMKDEKNKANSETSSDEDFHSDDNLRPYEEVKVAHHDKKFNGLGLTPEEHVELTSMGQSSLKCNHGNNKNPRLYNYMDASDGDIDSDHNVSSLSTKHASMNVHHQGSQCSISSNELDHAHSLRNEVVSRLSMSDSDHDEQYQHSNLHYAGTQLGALPPCFTAPPPPPPIEDIPHHTSAQASRQRSFGPSNRGNYSDAETTCTCRGHIDSSTALLHNHHNQRGHYSDGEHNYPQMRHCPYSGEESDFEPHYLEQTASGNVFIPDGQPRFPRTVPKSGSVPMSRSGELVSPQAIRPQGSNTVPNHFMNGDHHSINSAERQAFIHHTHFGCQQGLQMAPGYPQQMAPADCGYYSKFSSTSQCMKKKLQQRCSWRCTALILVIICVALLACTAYFAANLVFEEKEKVAQPLNGALNTSSTALKFINPATLFRLGEVKQSRIPPKTFWQTSFTQDKAKFVKFNFSFPNTAILAVYIRQGIAPTVAQFDFFEVFDGSTLSSRTQKRSKTRYKRSNGKDTALIRHMERGVWHMSIYNDRDTPQYISFRTDLLDSIGTDCPNDCHGHGECHNGHCQCFPGYTGWDCSKDECPELCSGHGVYDQGVCRCHSGWKGRECDITEYDCEVPDCNGNGNCINGQCVCRKGFQGPHCGLVTCLNPNCSGNGVCYHGNCICYKGYKGPDCTVPDKLNISQICARNCSGHGQYDFEKGQCICDRFFSGPDCEKENCRLECNHGHCQHQQCICDPGWGGVQCDQLSCDHRCDGLKGSCHNGTCVCRKGWNGKHCTIDGCPNDCSGHGQCRHYSNSGWKCSCQDGWKGNNCNVAMEMICNDNEDNDRDDLQDCMDPDCCTQPACTNNNFCKTVPDPAEILLVKQPPGPTASFYERMRFLIEENSVQRDTSRNAFNESQVSVIRGKVETIDGSPLIGVQVHVIRQPLYGYTLTRREGLFDILVNGGGSVTLEFTRQPFESLKVSVLVPWNQIITMDTVIMVLKRNQIFEPDPSLCGVVHDHYSLKPVVLSTWQHTQLGACPEKSTLIPESQVLQESLEIAASNVHLVYHSSETEGYKSVILIQMTPEVIPANLALVHLKVSVQGVDVDMVFEADPGLKYSFSWDRKNAYKQKVYGIVPARVQVGYAYLGCDYIFWESRSTTLSGFDLTSSEIGGWNLDIHHTYNFQEGILHKGDGSNIYLKEKPQELVNILGNGLPRTLDCGSCNGDARNNRLLAPVAMASGRDGSLYVWDLNFIRKLSPGRDDIASILETSTISTSHKTYMTVSPVDGRLYISDYMKHRVIRIATMGPVRKLAENYEVVAGTGEECTPGSIDRCGDGGLATQARLTHPKGIAISKEGIIYLADNLNIRMIDTNGIITTLIGSQGQPRSWEPMSCEDSQPANKMRLQWPTDLAIDPLDNSLHILDKNIILKLTKDKYLVTVAGRPVNCPIRNTNSILVGVLSDEDEASSVAADVKLINPQSIAFGPYGEIYTVESDTHSINRVRVITSDGRIHHFAGTKSKCDCQKPNCQCFDSEETLAAQALFKELTSVTVTPDGIVHIADAGNFRVFSIMSKLPQPTTQGQYEVFSPDTQEVYVFNSYGQHQHTVDIMTSQYMYNFTYNVNSFYGKLIRVADDAGNKIELVRDYELKVKEILSPDGHKSKLKMDNMKRLEKFISPSNSTVAFTYLDSTGLVESKYFSDGQSYYYKYNNMGRLLEARQPTGEITSLVTDVNTTGSIVQINTDNSDAVAMATYGSVQSVMHVITQNGAAETQVTYLPDGAVVVVFPSNLSISIESGGHPILANQHRMHFKRKIIAPNKLVHKLEWRFYVRKRRDPSRQQKVPKRIGNRMRVGAMLSRQHASMLEHDNLIGKGKALLVNGKNLLTVDYDRETHTESIINNKNQQEIITIVYDDSGLPIQFLPANGHHNMNISYSQSGHITYWQYGEMMETRVYNSDGLLKKRSESSGAQYRFQYRFKKSMPTDIIMPNGLQYYLAYNNEGDLVNVRTPDIDNHYFHRIISVGVQRYLYNVPALQNPYSEEYDGNGKLLQVVYPSEQRRTIYRYNSYSQLTRKLFDETEVIYHYDKGIQKLVSAEVLNGTYSCLELFRYSGSMIFGYDVEFSKDHRLKTGKFSYQYDNNFRIKQIHGNFGDGINDTFTDFTYDVYTGKMKTLNSLSFSWIVWDKERISDSHITISRDYDKYGRLQNAVYQFKDVEKFKLKVGYDMMNRIHRWESTVGDKDTVKFQYIYDINGNVKDVLLNGQPTWRYNYNNNGNINLVTERGSTRGLEYDAGDRIEKSGQKRYRFDNDGFMAQRHDQQISFNSNGQLASVLKLNMFHFMYFYDSQSRLVMKKSNGGQIMQYFYGDNLHPKRITHTYNSATSELTEYLYEADYKLIAMKRNGVMYYIATAPMFSPLAIFDSDGKVVKVMTYDPLGNMETDSNPNFEFSFGFQGGLYNTVTKLVHFFSRVYDTDNGHWISPDYSGILRNIGNIPNDPTLTNNYNYKHLVNIHSVGKKYPIIGISDWLMLLGYDVRSLAPDVSYTGEIRPQKRDVSHSLLPMSSAFECTFLHDMDSLLTMSTVPKSKVSPLQTQKDLKPGAEPSILGEGVTLTYRDGHAVVGLMDNTPDWTKQLALVLVNGSEFMDLKFNIKGKDVHYLLKSNASKANEDLRTLGISSDRVYYENDLNVTVNKVKHKNGFRLSPYVEVDVRLHGKHSVINIRYGTAYARERERILKHAKDRAVQHAWDREKWILKNGLASKYPWSDNEKKQIRTVGYADGYQGYYLRNPEFYPELADDCNNIKFIKDVR